MLELQQLEVDEIATALSDQTDYDHRWLIDPRSGQIAFWTSDTGIDGEPVDLDEVDLIPIDPLPSYVWYEDMADFAEGVSDNTAGRRLGRAIRGKGNLAVLFDARTAGDYLVMYERAAAVRVDRRSDLRALLCFDLEWQRFIPRQVAGRAPLDAPGMPGRVAATIRSALDGIG